MNVVCRIFGHHRSRRDARPLGNHRWRSICRHCRAPMVRVGPKLWKVVEAGSDELREDGAPFFLDEPVTGYAGGETPRGIAGG